MKFSKLTILAALVTGLMTLPATARADLVGRYEDASQLLLASDGQTVFATDIYSSAAGKTRVWDVAQKRELAALPTEAGIAVAVSRDGTRVLCRHKFDEVESSFGLWRLARGNWQAGTLIRSCSKTSLFDAHFVGENLVILWPDGVERRDAVGRRSQLNRWRLGHNYANSKAQSGALSSDGTRAVMFFDENFNALVLDAKSGRQLKRLALAGRPTEFDWNIEWKFSPDNSLIGWTFGAVPDNIQAPANATSYTQILWDARTGAQVSETSNPLIAFWPTDEPTQLNQIFDSAASPENWDENLGDLRWKIQRLDARTQKPLPLGISRIGNGFWLNDVQFSDDGQIIAALDAKGNIWVENSG